MYISVCVEYIVTKKDVIFFEVFCTNLLFLSTCDFLSFLKKDP